MVLGRPAVDGRVLGWTAARTAGVARSNRTNLPAATRNVVSNPVRGAVAKFDFIFYVLETLTNDNWMAVSPRIVGKVCFNANIRLQTLKMQGIWGQ